MSDRIRPSWHCIQTACNHLHSTFVATYDRTPDCIVGLTRGGLIPGTILSHLFNVPLIPVCYTSGVGNGSKTMYAGKSLHPIDMKPMDSSKLVVYVVDEICDTGHTLSEVCTYYTSLGYTVISGVIHHKSGAVHTPNFIWQHLTDDDPWVVYPWEVE